jgi:hypothetical protein
MGQAGAILVGPDAADAGKLALGEGVTDRRLR